LSTTFPRQLTSEMTDAASSRRHHNGLAGLHPPNAGVLGQNGLAAYFGVVGAYEPSSPQGP
jgi:hypothetical protein